MFTILSIFSTTSDAHFKCDDGTLVDNVKYDKGSSADDLVESLKGKGTG